MSGLTENHPLEPFLPGNAILLMLGSFPPQKKRWSMDFFYPNWSNDMWRIFGLAFSPVVVIARHTGSCFKSKPMSVGSTISKNLSEALFCRRFTTHAVS